MVIQRIEDNDPIPGEGDGVVSAGPKVAYDDPNRILENPDAIEYPVEHMTARYTDRFQDQAMGVGTSDLRVWGKAQTPANTPFEQAWQNLGYEDFLRLLYEEGLNAGSYDSASAYIAAMEDELERYDDDFDPSEIRPDGWLTFFVCRNDAEYLDYVQLGMQGATVGPFSPGLTFANTETITRSSGSWITDGFEIGSLAVIAGATGSTEHNGRFMIQDLSATVMTLARDPQFVNATETLCTLTPVSKNNAVNVVKEYFRTIYEANSRGRSRILTTQTKENIAANEKQFNDTSLGGANYGYLFRAPIDSGVLHQNGGSLVQGAGGQQGLNLTGPSFGWIEHGDFGLGDMSQAPDPYYSKLQFDALPDGGKVALNRTDLFYHKEYKLKITSDNTGLPGGTIKIGFPYFRTEADEVTGFGFNNVSKQITRNDGGSWITDGYANGRSIRINGGSTSNGSTTPKLIVNVASAVITLDAGETLNTASGDKTVTFDAIEYTGDIDVSEPVRARVGITPFVDTVNGINVGTALATRISRLDGGSWTNEGYITGDSVVIANATNAAHNGTYVINTVSAANLTFTTSPFGSSTAADKTITVSRLPSVQLRKSIKDAIDALSTAPQCITYFWWDDSESVSVSVNKVVHIAFADQTKTRGVWDYNPPYPGYVCGPLSQGISFTNNVAPTRDTIVRNDGGSFITDGFAANKGVRVLNAANSANNGCYLIHSVTANTLTLKNRTFVPSTTALIPTSLTTSLNDTSATLRHTGFGVPVYITPEFSYHPDLHVIDSTDAKTTAVVTSVFTSLFSGIDDVLLADSDWLDENFQVVDLQGRCVAAMKIDNRASWLEDFFTPWWAEFKDLGGSVEKVYFDNEPNNPSAIKMNIQNNLPIYCDPATHGQQSTYNYYKYVYGKAYWQDYFYQVRSALKESYNTRMAATTFGERLGGRQDDKVQFMVSDLIQGKPMRGFRNAIKASFPNVTVYNWTNACWSVGTPSGDQSVIGLGHPIDGSVITNYPPLINSLNINDWDELQGRQPLKANDRTFDPNARVIVKTTQRDTSSVVTVVANNRAEIVADARLGNDQAFNNFFLVQYVYNQTRSVTGGSADYTYPIFYPITELGAADGNGHITTVKYKDFYFRDTTNGIDLGVGATTRIIRQDGRNWSDDGWAANDNVIVSNATNAAHNGTYVVLSLSTTTMTLTTSPFGSSTNNDTNVRIAKGSTSLITNSAPGNGGFAETLNSDWHWHHFLINTECYRSMFQASTRPAAIWNETVSRYVQFVNFDGSITPVMEHPRYGYVAEEVFHAKLHNMLHLIYNTSGSGTSQEAAYEEYLDETFLHLDSYVPWLQVKPLSVNSIRPSRQLSEYIVSGCILPNNKRLFRTTIRSADPQDLTVPGAVARATHEIGPIQNKGSYTVFRTRNGVRFSVPGRLLSEGSPYNSFGWWTMT